MNAYMLIYKREDVFCGEKMLLKNYFTSDNFEEDVYHSYLSPA